MYRLFLILLVLGITLAMLTGCRSSTLSPLPTSNTLQAGTQTPLSSSPVQQPEYGGTLRCVTNYSPAVLSYMAEMSVFDYWSIFPAVEKLMDASDDRSVGNGLEPVLAEQVEDDTANKRFVIHLRPGIHFSDGSVLNSDSVIWNYEKVLSWGGPQYRNSWKGIEKIDELTFEIDYTEYSNQLIQSWATIPIFSQAAWEKAAGGDEAKGKEWARANIVGTGPFVLKEFERDDHLTWVKNLDYWQKGKPYLDEISVRIIPDPTTAQTLMLSGERNFWVGPPVKNQIDLEKQGLVDLKGWMGFPQSLFPNTADPKSKWNDLRLRCALEHALDKPAIAKALGQGFYKAMRTLAPEGEWGYDPAYPAREYDPVKASALLAEAGYSNGLDAKLLILGDADSLDIGVALKHYLDAVGIRIDLDVADPGRFYSTLWSNQVPSGDLIFFGSGTGVNYLTTYMDCFSSDPVINYSYIGHSDEQRSMDITALKIQDAAGQKEMTRKIVNYVADQALIIPVFWQPANILMAPYVHQKMSGGTIRWKTEEVWMQKH